MADIISNAVQRLTSVIDKDSIDWTEFDRVLNEIDDINAFDEKYEETILAEFLNTADFYHNGVNMPEAIKQFLRHGYDVGANNGSNGGLALSSLCWSSYDCNILEAAKVLLDAGAPVIYESADDDPEDEPSGVLGSIGWKLSGAWAVDKDYDWANILEAYYTMVEAHIAGEDYKSIACHQECLGRQLTKVEATNATGFDDHGAIKKFADRFVIWFGEKPLVVSPYTEFVVNPVWVTKNNQMLVNSNALFSEIIGATLIEIRYIDSTFCYFVFDNGYRLFFASQDVGDRKRIGTFELRKTQDDKLCVADVEYIACRSGRSYAERVVDYEEEAVIFFEKDVATVLCPSVGDYGKHSICTIRCSADLLADYTRKLVLHSPESVQEYYEQDTVTAMKIRCGDKYLYLKTTDYYEIELKVSTIEYDPSENCLSLRSKPGERLLFENWFERRSAHV